MPVHGTGGGLNSLQMREISKVLPTRHRRGLVWCLFIGEPITGFPSTWRIREREDQIILELQRDSSPLPLVMLPKCFWRTFTLSVWTAFPNS